MPGVALHCRLAEQVLAESLPGHDLPFPAADPRCRNAFLQGAIGPDMGYFPGADPFSSDLAHYVRTADLARALVRGAATEVERAYAWGWVTHVLADVAIHPLVNRACGELVLGDAGRALTAADDASSHLRVEMGLDLACSALHPHLRSIRLRPVFAGREVRFLARAYRSTYGLTPALRPLLDAHVAAARLASSLLAIHRLLPRRAAGERRGILGVAPSDVQSSPHRSSGLALTQSFLTPVRPTSRLILGVREAVEGFGDLFRSHLDTGLRDLPNHNLDTGGVEEGEPTYPRTRQTVRLLASRTARGARSPASLAANAGAKPRSLPGGSVR